MKVTYCDVSGKVNDPISKNELDEIEVRSDVLRLVKEVRRLQAIIAAAKQRLAALAINEEGK